MTLNLCFPSLFSSFCPILLSPPESSLCFCVHCLILPHRHLGPEPAQKEVPLKRKGKKPGRKSPPANQVQNGYEHLHGYEHLTSVPTITIQFSKKSPEAHLILFAWVSFLLFSSLSLPAAIHGNQATFGWYTNAFPIQLSWRRAQLH